MGSSVIALYERNDAFYNLVNVLADPYRDPSPFFAAALCSEHTPTREKAAAMIRTTPSNTLVPLLIQRLKEEKSADVRAELVETLGFMRVREAVPSLLSLVIAKKALIRANVAEALGLIGVRSPAVDAALLTLLVDRSRIVRCYAVEALGDVGDPQVVLVPLKERQQAERSGLVGVWCIYGRARLGEAIDWEALRVAFRKRDPLVRRQALIVLRHLVTDTNMPRAVALLREAQGAEIEERLGQEMEAVLAVMERAETYP